MADVTAATSPSPFVAGIEPITETDEQLAAMLAEAELAPLLARRPTLKGRVTVVHAEGIVRMEDKPSQVLRTGSNTSMWSTIESVREGKAQAAVSCGNTGALMAEAPALEYKRSISALTMSLRCASINSPNFAISSLWRSR